MENSAIYPEFFARFYDTLYKHIRNSADHDFFLNRILEVKGPVLEVGTGTGRFFMDALEKGADIHGVDISLAMLDILKQKLPPSHHFRISVDDIRSMQLDKKFDLIIAPFRVFMHLVQVKDQLKALENVYQHLNPGGTFIFDCFVPNMKMLAEGLDRKIDFEGEYEPGKKLVRYASMHADPVNQISHVTFELEWDEDGKERSATWHTELRLFFRYELEHLIALSPLELDDIKGDFAGSPLSPDSGEFIVTCRKRM